MPSSEISALTTEEIEGVDSGFSDATPPAFSEDSQEPILASKANLEQSKMASNGLSADEEAILEDAADLNLPKEAISGSQDQLADDSNQQPMVSFAGLYADSGVFDLF